MPNTMSGYPTRVRSLPSVRCSRSAAFTGFLKRRSAAHQRIDLIHRHIDDRDLPCSSQLGDAMGPLVARGRGLPTKLAQLFPNILGRQVVEAGKVEQIAQHTQDLPTRA